MVKAVKAQRSHKNKQRDYLSLYGLPNQTNCSHGTSNPAIHSACILRHNNTLTETCVPKTLLFCRYDRK
jgi:hypothetical protein